MYADDGTLHPSDVSIYKMHWTKFTAWLDHSR